MKRNDRGQNVLGHFGVEKEQSYLSQENLDLLDGMGATVERLHVEPGIEPVFGL